MRMKCPVCHKTKFLADCPQCGNSDCSNCISTKVHLCPRNKVRGVARERKPAPPPAEPPPTPTKRPRKKQPESEPLKKVKLIARGDDTTNTIGAAPPASLAVGTWNLAHWGKGAIQLLKLTGAAGEKLNSCSLRAMEIDVDDLQTGEEKERALSEFFQCEVEFLTACAPILEVTPFSSAPDVLEQLDSRRPTLFTHMCFAFEDFSAIRDREQKFKRAGSDFLQQWAKLLKAGSEIQIRALFRSDRLQLTYHLRRARRASKRFAHHLPTLIEMSDRIALLNKLSVHCGMTPFGNLHAKKCAIILLDVKNPRQVLTAYNALIELDKTVHKYLIVQDVVELFIRNPWLQVLLLHEVNDAIADFFIEIRDYLQETKQALKVGMVAGPKLMSQGKAQVEYYPMINRASSEFTLKNCFTIDNHGNILNQPTEFKWSKTKKLYRPIVLYTFKMADGSKISTGIVHTTPAGSEFDRADVWKQLETPLAALHLMHTQDPKHHFIIGGDYYLTGEAAIVKYTDLTLRQKRLAGAEKKLRIADVRRRLEEIRDPDYLLRAHESIEGNLLEQDALLSLITKMEARAQLQFIRSHKDEHLSFFRKVESTGWCMCQPIGGTNLKSYPMKALSDIQIADFFLCSQTFTTHQVGLFDPEGSLFNVDSENLQRSLYWRVSSDHFPVGGLFALKPVTRWTDTFVREVKLVAESLRKVRDAVTAFTQRTGFDATKYFPELTPEEGDFESYPEKEMSAAEAANYELLTGAFELDHEKVVSEEEDSVDDLIGLGLDFG